MTISIDGTLVLDEQFGVQTEDTDNDKTFDPGVELAVAAYLAGLNTPSVTGFPQYAERTNFISSDTPVNDYALVSSSGGALFPATGIDSGIQDLDGNHIFLFAASDNNVVLGRVGTGSSANTGGEVAFAIVLDETKANNLVTNVNLWLVQYEPLNHNGPGSIGAVDDLDTLNLLNKIFVASAFSETTTVPFSDFSAVPSGQDAFAMIAPTGSSSTTDLLVTGFKQTTEGTVNVSSTGLGTNSQAIDQNESLRIDFVKDGDTTLSNMDVHNAANIAYDTHVVGNEASFQLVQTNPAKTTVSATVSAYNVVGDAKGAAFVTDAHASEGTPVTITGVTIYDAQHHVVTAGITVGPLNAPTVKIDGLKNGYFVDFTTSADMDRFTVTNSSAQSNRAFDLGNIAFSSTTVTVHNDAVELGSHLLIEDDGPSIALSAATHSLIVDESNLPSGSLHDATKTHVTADFSDAFTVTPGADGVGTTSYALSLEVADGTATTLKDTATDSFVKLYDVSGTIYGRDSLGDDVFSVSVDSTGNITLTQFRAVEHGDTADPNDLTPALGSGLISLTASVTDGDGDPASNKADVGSAIKFRDDGPSLTASAAQAGALTVDESDLNTNAMASFAGLFTTGANYGADGQGSAASNFTLGINFIPGTTHTGLFDTATGNEVALSLVNGHVLGTVMENGNAVTVFDLSVDSSGQVTLDQQRAVVHGSAEIGVPDISESAGLSSDHLITLSATITDKDGDTSSAATADIAGTLVFKDDGPSFGTVPNGTANYQQGVQDATGSFSAPGGADGGHVTIAHAADLTSVGLHSVFSSGNTVVTYYADAGNTDPVYRLTVTDTGYDFAVLKTLTSPPETLNFGALKSGSPMETLSVPTSAGHTIVFDGLLFTGSGPGSGATEASFLPYDLNSGTGDDLNPDNIGFGVKNGQASQINHNEGFFFETSTGLDLQNLTFDVAGIGNVSNIRMETWMYNDSGELIDYNNVLVSNLKTANQHVTVADDGGGGGAHDAAGETFDTGYVRFSFDNGDTNAGVRIINFTTQIAVQSHDRDLAFQLTNTDGDGDTANSNTFHVVVDNPLTTVTDVFGF